MHEGTSLTSRYDALRARLERVLELVQVEHAGCALAVSDELIELERAGRAAGLGRFADAAATAGMIALRWDGGALSGGDARVAVLRLALAMLRELTFQERLR